MSQLASYSQAREQTLECCEWSARSRKNWLIIGILFALLYAFDGLFIWGLMAAIQDDAETTLICYIVIFFISVIVIATMVLYGHYSGALQKISAQDHNENVVSGGNQAQKGSSEMTKPKPAEPAKPVAYETPKAPQPDTNRAVEPTAQPPAAPIETAQPAEQAAEDEAAKPPTPKAE